MIYGAADNNADGPILEFLGSIRRALDDDPGVELLLFLDRSDGFSDDASALGEDFTGARMYRLGAREAERLDGGEEFPEVRLDREWSVIRPTRPTSASSSRSPSGTTRPSATA